MIQNFYLYHIIWCFFSCYILFYLYDIYTISIRSLYKVYISIITNGKPTRITHVSLPNDALRPYITCQHSSRTILLVAYFLKPGYCYLFQNTPCLRFFIHYSVSWYDGAITNILDLIIPFHDKLMVTPIGSLIPDHFQKDIKTGT